MVFYYYKNVSVEHNRKHGDELKRIDFNMLQMDFSQ